MIASNFVLPSGEGKVQYDAYNYAEFELKRTKFHLGDGGGGGEVLRIAADGVSGVVIGGQATATDPTVTGLTVIGDISSSGYLEADSYISTDSHITASGNISASGGFIGNTLTLDGLSTQGSETTAVMINGSDVVGTRDLGSNAFTSTTIGTTTNALTAGAGILAAGTFNGAAARTFSIDSASFAPFFSASMNDFTTTGTGSFGGDVSASGVIRGIGLDINGTGTFGDTTIDDDSSINRDLTVGRDLLVSDDIIHNGDTDTKIAFGADSITMTAGNIEMVKLVEGVADAVTINEGGVDVNVRIESVNKTAMLFIDAANDKMSIGGNLTTAPPSTLTVHGDISSSGMIFLTETGSAVQGNVPSGIGALFVSSSGHIVFQSGSTTTVLGAGGGGGSGDITGVTAGTGMTGGGDSGAVTLNVIGGTGITANADDIAIAATHTTITSILNDSLKVGRADGNDSIDFGTDDQILFDVDNTERLRVDAAGVDVTGALTVSSNATISGDLTVNGTTTTITSTNTAIADRFIMIASGSAASNTDGGIVVQEGANEGTGSALYHDTGDNRWAVAKSVIAKATAVTALEHVVTVKQLGDNDAPVDGDKEYGAGEMAINSNGTIWIYS